MRAFLRLLAVQGPVSLLVAGEVGGRCIILATFVARVSASGPVDAQIFGTIVANFFGFLLFGAAVSDEECFVGVFNSTAVVTVAGASFGDFNSVMTVTVGMGVGMRRRVVLPLLHEAFIGTRIGHGRRRSTRLTTTCCTRMPDHIDRARLPIDFHI